MSKVVERYKGLPFAPIPRICYECIEFLRKNGLEIEGLFRVPGNNLQINSLKASFEKDEDILFVSGETGTNVHVVGGVLKAFFRDLPEPVIPFQQYDDIIKLAHVIPAEKKDAKVKKKIKLNK